MMSWVTSEISKMESLPHNKHRKAQGMTKTRTAFHSPEVSQGLSMNKDTKKSETMCETQFAGTEQLKGS